MDDRYVEALKALAEPHRLRLFWLLLQINERICVAEAMDVLGETHYNVSRNLKTLLRAGLVHAEKDGKWVFYTLSHKDDAFHRNLVGAVRAIPRRNSTTRFASAACAWGCARTGVAWSAPAAPNGPRSAAPTRADPGLGAGSVQRFHQPLQQQRPLRHGGGQDPLGMAVRAALPIHAKTVQRGRVKCGEVAVAAALGHYLAQFETEIGGQSHRLVIQRRDARQFLVGRGGSCRP